MKKYIAIFLLSLLLTASFTACNKKRSESEPFSNIVEDGEEISVSDFLIKHLNEYIQSEGYLERKANYEEIYGNEENDFSFARVIDISANIPPTKLPIHLLAVKANCRWVVEAGVVYDSTLLVVDYDSGKIYDKFTVDDSWQNKNDSVEQQIWFLTNGILNSETYDGGTILQPSEIRTELSESEIAKINKALKQ